MSNNNLLAESLAIQNAALQRRVAELEQQLATQSQMEARLRRSEAQLVQAQQLARVGSYVLDFVTGAVEWSTETFRLLGIDPADGPPSTEDYMARIHPDDRAAVAEMLEQSITAGTRFDLEYRFIRPDGSVKYIHSVAQPTLDDQGTVISLVGMIADMTEHRQAEAEQARLLTQLRTFQLLVEHAVDAIVVADLSGQVRYANHAYHRLFGYTSSAVGTSSATVVAESEERLRAVGQRIATEGIWQGVLTYRRLNGETFPGQISSSILRDATGDLQGFATIIRDLSEQQRIEQALRDSQQMLRMIIDNIPLSIFWKNRDLTYLGCNLAFARSIGCDDPDEVIGKTDFDMPWHPFAEKYRADDRYVIENDIAIYNYEEPFQDQAQIPGWARTSKIPLHDSTTGAVTSLLGIFENITARKQAEEELRTFKALVDNAPDSIGVTALDGSLIYANSAYRRLTGYGEALLGKIVMDLYTDSADVLNAAFRQMVEQGSWQGELTLRCQHGELIPIQMSAVVIKDAEGRPLAFGAISRDMREQRRAEQERLALQEQVIAAQRQALRELSTPLIPLADGIVAMPLIGSIDSARAQEIMETLLQGVADSHATTAIVDITGVPVVDTQVASALIQTAQAVRLLGARVIVTGIRPEIAQTLVGIGIDLRGIVTLSSLQTGIAYALRQWEGRT